MFIPNEPGDGEYLARGVYRARYKVQGYPALVAINSEQNAIKHLKLEPYDDELLAWKRLWAFLDARDPLPDPPPPPVRLVTEATDDAPPAPSTPLPHPCQRDDQVSFHLRVAQREVDRLRRYEER